ncbi:MAG: redoxin family protein [Bacteroidota bacterium]
MKHIHSLLLLLILHFSCPAQELFEDRVDHFIDSLKASYGENLRDSIWPHLRNDFPTYITQARFGNYTYIDVHGDSIQLDDIHTPLFVQATASWCKPCKAEIPALNELAQKYENKVSFLLFTHDAQKAALRLSAKLHENIIVIPSEKNSFATSIVKMETGNFKHILSFPTTYYTDKQRVIQSVFRGGLIVTKDQTAEDIYNFTVQMISEKLDEILKDRE